MEKPKFLEFGEAALADWRGHPVSAAMLEWLAWEADQSNYGCAALLRKGESDKATAVAGEAQAFERVIGQCYRRDPAPEPQDEPFIDAAYRFQPDKAPKQQQQDEGENAGET